MTGEGDFQKYAAMVRVTREMLDNAAVFQAEMDRWQRMTPEARRAAADEARGRRRTDREAATPSPLTLDAVLEGLGWSREYAEHFVQSFCGCGEGSDGWDYCRHAEDLGLTP